MNKKNIVLFTAILLCGSILFSCNNKGKDYASDLRFDSIKVNETQYLFGDTAKPNCNVTIDYIFPVKASNRTVLDSINKALTRICFGDKYVGKQYKVAIELFKADYVNQYKKEMEPLYTQDKAKSNGENVEAWYSYFKGIEARVKLKENNLLVYKVEVNEYTGGAHGTYITTYLNINLKNGKQIRLDDLFTSGYESKLTDILLTQLMKDNKVSKKEELEDMGYFLTGELTPTSNFFIDNKGITFCYNIYEIAPYSMGITEIKLSFDSLKDLLKEETPINNLL